MTIQAGLTACSAGALGVEANDIVRRERRGKGLQCEPQSLGTAERAKTISSTRHTQPVRGGVAKWHAPYEKHLG